MMEIPADYRAGYVAIIGKPNVGKSTLLNSMLDFKLSIISPRPQTTRRRVMGIVSKEHYQAIFLDTPGILEPRYQLQVVMMNQVVSAVYDADVLLYLVEMWDSVKGDRDTFGDIAKSLKEINPARKPVICAINKIDLFEKHKLLPVMERLSALNLFTAIIPISALKEDGLNSLETEITRFLPLNPPFYDPEILTEQPERFFAAEFIREQIFLRFSQEIPYATEVQIDEYKERENGKDLIMAVIYVERDSQKAILIGKNGAALKAIGSAARKSIELFTEREIYLDLRVKVNKEWRRNEKQIRRFGY